MTTLSLATFSLVCSAQIQPKASAAQRQPDEIALPPGWVLIVPPEGTLISKSKPIAVPKDWIYSRPEGVPTAKPFVLPKDWQYSKPDGVPSSKADAAIPASKSAGIDWADFLAKDDASDKLIKAQSIAISALKDRVDKLEVKLQELESRGGLKK